MNECTILKLQTKNTRARIGRTKKDIKGEKNSN